MAAVVLMVAIACLTPSLAHAQRKGLNDKILEKDTSKSYALPYGLVVLGVALGVMIVARPSTRAEEVKRRVDEDEEQ
jgi:hypothetical protein